MSLFKYLLSTRRSLSLSVDGWHRCWLGKLVVIVGSHSHGGVMSDWMCFRVGMGTGSCGAEEAGFRI